MDCDLRGGVRAFYLAYFAPSLQLHPEAPFVALGVTAFAVGISLRWYSILYLGRFFTVNVAIAPDHRLIDTGPTAASVTRHTQGRCWRFSGIGLCLGNAGSLAAILIPTLGAFILRMRIEERALCSGLGESYRDYMRRTKRLIPSVY